MRMPLEKAKIYFDGSNYIATPHTFKVRSRKRSLRDNFGVLPRRNNYGNDGSFIFADGTRPKDELPPKLPAANAINLPEAKLTTVAPKQAETLPQNVCEVVKRQSNRQLFEQLYRENLNLPKKQRLAKITEEMLPRFNGDSEQAKTFVEENFARLERNRITRMVRLKRKVYLQQWTHFVTFTYDSALHTEETFRMQLLTCLRHLAHRKGWKYVGVFERSPQNKRLHFHGIFYIPQMIGEIVECRDYDTKNRKLQITFQNTHFQKRFGRCDFQPLLQIELSAALAYLVKYVSKTGEKIIYSRGLPTHFVYFVYLRRGRQKVYTFATFHLLVGLGIYGRSFTGSDCQNAEEKQLRRM